MELNIHEKEILFVVTSTPKSVTKISTLTGFSKNCIRDNLKRLQNRQLIEQQEARNHKQKKYYVVTRQGEQISKAKQLSTEIINKVSNAVEIVSTSGNNKEREQQLNWLYNLIKTAEGISIANILLSTLGEPVDSNYHQILEKLIEKRK